MTIAMALMHGATPMPDGRCTFAATSRADRIAIVESMEARRFLRFETPATVQMLLGVRACGERAGWTAEQQALEGGRALDLMARSVFSERLSAARIDTALIDRWFSALGAELQIARDMPEAETARLADLLVAAGTSRDVVAANRRAIQLYALTLAADETARRDR